MRLLGLKTFRHGIHPPESKDETNGLAIRQFPFAPLLIIPVAQSMGKPPILEVEEGHEVAGLADPLELQGQDDHEGGRSQLSADQSQQHDSNRSTYAQQRLPREVHVWI